MEKGQIPPLIFVGILAGIIIILYVIGGFVSAQGIEIAGCRAQWSTSPRQVTSELCPNATEPCIAQPFAQQHNAIVQALTCACGRASDGGTYSDSALNSQIESTFSEASGAQLNVREICENGGGGFMVRWRYA